MIKISQKTPIFMFHFILFMLNLSIFPQIIETVEVEGRLFSQALNSKNMVIILQSDIRELQIKDMSELFTFFSSLNINRRGASETSFDITMRGCNFEQVLILVNGIPQNNPQTGHFNTDFPFSVGDIERIEIARGGSSTTYGGYAFAGFINIILKRKGDLSLSVTSGDHNYFATCLNIGKQIKDIHLRFSVNRSNSAGYHPGREFDSFKCTTGGFYRRKDIEMDFQAGYLVKDFGAMGFYAPFFSKEKINAYFYQFHFKKVKKKLMYSVKYAYNKHNDFFILDRFNPEYFENESNTSQKFINFSIVLKEGKLLSSAGFEGKLEGMDSSTMGKHDRYGGTFFLNFDYQINQRIGFDGGVRQSFFSEGHSNLTYYYGCYYYLKNGTIMRAGVGRSFRMPSFTELYYHSPANRGNINLKPESSLNIETSFSILKEKFSFDLSLFYRDQKDIIDWVKFNNSSIWQAINVDEHDIFGTELGCQFNFGRSKMNVGLEGLTAVNRNINFISKYGLRFPDFNVKVMFIQSIGKKLKAAVTYNYKHLFNTEEKGHFINLVFNVSFKSVMLSLRCDNLFNSMIEEIPGLEVPGRWLYLTVSLR